MIRSFSIAAQQGVYPTSLADSNWIALNQPSAAEEMTIKQKYHLPPDFFQTLNRTQAISRLEPVSNHSFAKHYLLVLTNLTANRSQTIEQRLEPLIFIKLDQHIVTYSEHPSNFFDQLLDQFKADIQSIEDLIAYSIRLTYNNYQQQLNDIKTNIDFLETAARTTTKNSELIKLAETDKEIIYIDHTLTNQKDTLAHLWHKTEFKTALNNPDLLANIKLHQKHAEQSIIIYKDLLETIGGLFTDMMDNNLNQLMKYLDSAALIISVPTLVSGIWGMNTGGLPGEQSEIGFWLVMIIAVIATIIITIHLKRKDF